MGNFTKIKLYLTREKLAMHDTTARILETDLAKIENFIQDETDGNFEKIMASDPNEEEKNDFSEDDELPDLETSEDEISKSNLDVQDVLPSEDVSADENDFFRFRRMRSRRRPRRRNNGRIRRMKMIMKKLRKKLRKMKRK